MTAYRIEEMAKTLEDGNMVKCGAWLIVPHHLPLGDKQYTMIQPDTGRITTVSSTNDLTWEFQDHTDFEIVHGFNLSKAIRSIPLQYPPAVDWNEDSGPIALHVAFFDHGGEITHKKILTQSEMESLSGEILQCVTSFTENQLKALEDEWKVKDLNSEYDKVFKFADFMIMQAEKHQRIFDVRMDPSLAAQKAARRNGWEFVEIFGGKAICKQGESDFTIHSINASNASLYNGKYGFKTVADAKKSVMVKAFIEEIQKTDALRVGTANVFGKVVPKDKIGFDEDTGIILLTGEYPDTAIKTHELDDIYQSKNGVWNLVKDGEIKQIGCYKLEMSDPKPEFVGRGHEFRSEQIEKALEMKSFAAKAPFGQGLEEAAAAISKQTSSPELKG